MKSLAIEYCLKGIELTETYHVDNYNISTSYTEVAKYYINQGDISKALEMLKKRNLRPMQVRMFFLQNWDMYTIILP